MLRSICFHFSMPVLKYLTNYRAVVSTILALLFFQYSVFISVPVSPRWFVSQNADAALLLDRKSRNRPNGTLFLTTDVVDHSGGDSKPKTTGQTNCIICHGNRAT